MNDFIFVDYLTLTSKSNSLRHFCFQVIKNYNIKIQFTSKTKFKTGGPSYRGKYFCFKDKNGNRQGFIGKRVGSEYILTVFSSLSSFFLKDFLTNPASTEWRITRLDLKCSFPISKPSSAQRMRRLYVNFSELQRKFEKTKPKKLRKKVRFLNEDVFNSVTVGSNQSGRTRYKLYTRFEEDEEHEKDFAVQFETTFRNYKTLKSLYQNQSSSYDLVKEHLDQLVQTSLLRPHRKAIKDFFLNKKTEAKHQAKAHAEAHPKAISKKKNQFKPFLILIAEQLQKLDEALKPIVSCLSDNQIEFLNQQFPASSWRITWRNPQQWAICPNKNEKLIKWLPIFDKLPTRTKDRNLAVTNRKKAYSELAEYFEKTTEQFRKISITKQAKASAKAQANAQATRQLKAPAKAQAEAQQYRNDTRANSFVTKLLQILENDEFFPVDNTINKLPQRRNNDFYFDDKPLYIQDIIIKKQQQKTIKAFRSNLSNLRDENSNSS